MALVSFEELDDEDVRALRGLISEHHRRTGSTVAAGLLEDWGSSLERFVKVMPNDYRRVLDARSAQAVHAAAAA